MLIGLYVDNFRCLVNFQIEFSKLNLLLGPNGSGKTTTFEVLRRLRDFIAGRMTVSEAFPSETMTKWYGKRQQVFRLQVKSPDGPMVYELIVTHDAPQGKPRVNTEKLHLNGRPLCHFEDGGLHLFNDRHQDKYQMYFDWFRSAIGFIAPRPENKKLTWFRQTVEHLVITRPLPRLISAESTAEDQSLNEDGSNFANWYRFFSQEHQDRAFELTDALREQLDGFYAFKLVQSGRDRKLLQVTIVSGNGASNTVDYAFDELSEGERMLILIYTLLLAAGDAEQSVFIDEPDNFVSLPEIQPWLMKLRDLCSSKNTQVILISHHPEFIDYLGPDCGLWFERTANGPTTVGSVPQPPDGVLKLSEQIERGWK